MVKGLKSKACKWVLTLSCMAVCIHHTATSAADFSERTNEALRQQQQQQSELLQIQMEQRQRQLQRGAFGAGKSTDAVTDSPLQDTHCWSVQGVHIGGVSLLNLQALQEQIKPLISRCMGVGQINHLLTKITQLYVDAGYIASRPYLSRSPENGKSLSILVEEGFIESIELADQSLPVSLRGAFPGMLGKPLNLRDLEQGLDQLNRLRSLDMTADIAPGQFQGGSRIIVRSRDTASRLSLSLGEDNLGSPSSGRDRSSLSVSLDSPLELNDSLTLGSSDTLNRGDRFSRSRSLFYSVPYGYWTFSTFASRSEYSVPVRLATMTVDSEGRTDVLSLRSDRVLWRGQRHQLSANLQLSHKRVDNFFFNEHLAIQSPTLTVAEAGLNMFWLDRATWNLDFSYAQGLTWFGADRDGQRLLDDLPRPQFRKVRASISQWRNGLVFSRPWRWSSQLSLQYSPDPLPAIEQVLLTDDSAVRGFQRNSLSGASAAIWRNTVGLPVQTEQPIRVLPHIGMDLGWVKYDHGVPPQSLSGASLGVDLGWRTLQVGLDYQHSLHTPKYFLAESDLWLMRMTLSF